MQMLSEQQLAEEFSQAVRMLDNVCLASDRKRTEKQGSFVQVLKRLKATERNYVQKTFYEY